MSAIDFTGMTAQQRLDLIGELCDSLEGEDLPISPALRTELEWRNARFEEDRDKARRWSEIYAEFGSV